MRRQDVTPGDVRDMQRLVQRIWSLDSGWHIGDVAWGRFQHSGREPEWPTSVWYDDRGEPVAFGWIRLPGQLDLAVDPAHPRVLDAMLDWFEDVATADRLDVVVLDTERHLHGPLAARGYRPDPAQPVMVRMDRPLAGLPELPAPPAGFRVRAVRGPEDLDRRVEAHRAAFHPSRITPDSYRTVMAAWPYRPDLDWVVEAPDGTFAAFCLIWPDPANGVGELEPVGTHPDFRGRRLAGVACLAAMHALAGTGAGTAVVYTWSGPTDRAGRPAPTGYPHPGDPGDPGDAGTPSRAGRLYARLGFRPHARTVNFRRDRHTGRD